MAQNINPIKIVRSFAKDLTSQINVEKVILFGSASRNQMTYDSDIDVIILSPDFKKLDFIQRLQLLSRARKGDARKIPMDILGYTEEEFSKISKESIVLNEAQKEGKIISLI